MKYKVAVAKGDGVGPEVVDSALAVLKEVQKKFNIDIEYKEVLVGGAAYEEYKNPLPARSLDEIQESHAVLFGAVGGKQWDKLELENRPEKAILGLRQKMNLYTNLRPGILFGNLVEASPLKNKIVEGGFDILVVRELLGGIYFGEKGTSNIDDKRVSFDKEVYSDFEIARIAKRAFEFAMARNKKLVSVDKANVLESSRLWRKVVEEVALDYPEVSLSHMYIDNAAMQVARDPKQFDVILTSNLFGDILSDEISILTGSIGLLPSASLGDGSKGLYEPIHGSAPDIAGMDIVNPIGAILSATMMLEYSFDNKEAALAIRHAVSKALGNGYRTKDITLDSETFIGTKEITKRIIEMLNYYEYSNILKIF